ncbi:hypothetical protein FRZ61_24750 [Hypericibacter adhaerens]|uniref:Uncharacterized protein n=1 Tax=Hypericibacter adhaerens TaxID=2602016 RepID=A0A5J6N097_9PROT|nr:hypothetical protein [Hypericibacter adhaerens]QEX22543.1 hypothetical protein FRZ61_24750 [Hypericibacter adhaerens]
MVSPYLVKPLRTVDEVVREQEDAQRRRLSRGEGHALLEPQPGQAGRTPRADRDKDGLRRGPRATIE